MSVRYLSDWGLKIARPHPAVMLKVQSSFPSEGHNTVWSLGAGGAQGGRRKRWLPCDKRAVPSSQAWETGSAAHKALLWRRGNARSSKIRAPIWLSMTGACPPRPHRDLYPPHVSPPLLDEFAAEWRRYIKQAPVLLPNRIAVCNESPVLSCGGIALTFVRFKCSSSKITSSEAALRCVKPFCSLLNPPTYWLRNNGVSKG